MLGNRTRFELSAVVGTEPPPSGSHGRNGFHDRYPQQLVTYLAGSVAGRVILDALQDDDVTEVYVNSDRKVWKETYSAGPTFTGCLLEADFATMFLNAVATRHHVTLDRENPAISAELPEHFFNRARLQGEIPPLVEHPSFNIRKPPPRTFALNELVTQGVLTPGQRAVVREAVVNRWNVVIAGNVSSGKTTFARAVLKEIAELCPRDRLLILEDTPELRSESPNTHLMRKPEHWELTPLVTITLRKNAKRICVSEVRDREALPLLDAWTTHRGGLATTHADSIEKCLDRLDRLAMRNGVPSDPVLIAQAIQLVILLEGDNEGRRVMDMARVMERDDRENPYTLRRYDELGRVR
jgi:type IV secretion system protein VirB11